MLKHLYLLSALLVFTINVIQPAQAQTFDWMNELYGFEAPASDRIFYVDASQGIDDFSQPGGSDSPWKSITWAMNNIPFEYDNAVVVVRSGTYSPPVIYISAERGGSADNYFTIVSEPDSNVVIDGANVASGGALVSVAGATHVRLAGLDFANLVGSGKSAIYISDSQDIQIIKNTIRDSYWTVDTVEAQTPSLADRLNGIVVTGNSTDVLIQENALFRLTTGYGDPILILDPALATETDNLLYDNDALVFENQQYFVSPNGNDETGIGTFENPWQSIHKALFSIPYEEDSAVVNILAGTYQIPTALFFEELRGGGDGKYFTVKAFNNEEVIIDGSLLVDDFSAMVSFSSAAYVRIEGLSFTNLVGPKSGIYMEGTSHHIELINNKLYNMTWADDETEDEANPLPSDNLNPIAVIGNDALTPMNNIVIRGNELYNIVPGYSEGIKIVGNVTDFEVSDNYVHDIANIGIVAAGNYSWVGIPAEVNHARNGVIKNNIVHDAVSPVANSAGIYLDGANNMLVENNTSYNNSVGFSVGCEQPGSASTNTLRGNLAYDNLDAGLVVGTIHAGAVVSDTTIEYNEFRSNYRKGGYGGEITVQQAEGLVVKKNIIHSLSDIMVIISQVSTDLDFDNNLYYGASEMEDTAMFDWGGISATTFVGLAQFQSATCLASNSIYQSPDSIDFFNTPDGTLDLCNPTINEPVEPNVLYQIVSKDSGKCLDISRASTRNGAALIEWYCNGNKNQQFMPIDETTDLFSLTVEHSQKVLHFNSQEKFIQKSYKENARRQLFHLNANEDGSYQICSVVNGACVGDGQAYIFSAVEESAISF